MRTLNVHERSFRCSANQAGELLDSLASPHDVLWPSKHWPRMRLDRPLGVGATGGHGPIRYSVTAYVPGRKVTFRFLSPQGFVGTHWFEVLDNGASSTTLRHTIDMSLHGAARLSWPLAIRPLHNALVEDALTNAQVALGENPTPMKWSPWVHLLRKVLSPRAPKHVSGRADR